MNTFTFGKEQVIINKNQMNSKIKMQNNLYEINLVNSEISDHARLGHPGRKLSDKLEYPLQCEVCIRGEFSQKRYSKYKESEVKRCFERLHMDLIGPFQIKSLGGKNYILTIVDEFSSFSWVYFLEYKSEAFEKFMDLCEFIKNQFKESVGQIKTDKWKRVF